MSVDVRSLDALPELASALARFHAQASGALRSADDDARRALERLDAAIRRHEYEVEQLRREYDERDEDDDADALRDRMDAAEDALRRTREARDQVEACHETFRRAAERAGALLDGSIPAARGLLDRKHHELRRYVALAPPGHRHAPAPGSAALPTAPAASPAPPASAAGPPRVALPGGFAWVAVDDVEPVALADDEFRKVTADEVARGFGVLARRVLPALAARGADADSAFFGDGDRDAGTAYAEGSQRVYDAFFGDDAIHLSRRADDAAWSVTNGRHRIQVARRLGVTHVPARVGVGG